MDRIEIRPVAIAPRLIFALALLGASFTQAPEPSMFYGFAAVLGVMIGNWTLTQVLLACPDQVVISYEILGLRLYSKTIDAQSVYRIAEAYAGGRGRELTLAIYYGKTKVHLINMTKERCVFLSGGRLQVLIDAARARKPAPMEQEILPIEFT